MADQQPPLSYEASATANHPQVSDTLPQEVVQCLKNARFLHLATCDALQPHVSLMNYTYLPSSPYSSYPTIVMTTNPSSKKALNMLDNPRVSLLVHDWVSHRPPTAHDSDRSGSPPPRAARSSLASLLLNLNTSALSSISATLNGVARVVDKGSEEETWLKERHLENNTFGEGVGEIGFVGGPAPSQDDGGRGCFIEGEEVRVVVVRINDGRIADFKGTVKDFVVRDRHDDPLVNGINDGTGSG